MEKLIEVRWHGRGGQGAVTASKLLATSALAEDKYIQAFPEYGPERMGAPIQSFTRISKNPIKIHCHIIFWVYVNCSHVNIIVWIPVILARNIQNNCVDSSFLRCPVEI